MENNNEENTILTDHSTNGTLENKQIEAEIIAEPATEPVVPINEVLPSTMVELSQPIAYTAKELLAMSNEELVEIGNAIVINDCGVMKKEDLCSAILRAQRKLVINIKN